MPPSQRSGNIALAPVELLIFQGTPFCNIDCRYCYLPHRSDRSRISIETIRTTCRRLVQSNLIVGKPEILWHAGEPLALPVEFYDEAFAAIEEELHGLAVEHAIQTNATLIDDRWIKLFKQWNVSVGVSLDGPPRIHDRCRVTRSGGPTSSRVLAGIAKLKQVELKLKVICVLTRDSIGMPEELFAFFESLGVDHVAFNIDEAEGPHLRSSHEDTDPLPIFRRFFRRYFELVATSKSRQSVREMTRGLTYVFNANIQSSYETMPIRVLTVGHDGDFCTFSPELFGLHHQEFGPLILGNIHDGCVFEKLPNDPRFIEIFLSIRRGIEACERSCDYYEICKGGLPSNKLGEFGTFEATETIACKFKRKAVADAVVDMLVEGSLQDYEGARIA